MPNKYWGFVSQAEGALLPVVCFYILTSLLYCYQLYASAIIVFYKVSSDIFKKAVWSCRFEDSRPSVLPVSNGILIIISSHAISHHSASCWWCFFPWADERPVQRVSSRLAEAATVRTFQHSSQTGNRDCERFIQGGGLTLTAYAGNYLSSKDKPFYKFTKQKCS